MKVDLSNVETLQDRVIVCAIEPKFVKPKTAERIFSRSHNSIMKDARQAQAIARVGGSVLISVDRMTKYYDSLCGNE